MDMISKIRLVLAGVLLGAASIFAAETSTDPNEKLTEAEKKQYEYLKKAKYFEIRAELEGGYITLEEAQKRWLKELRKIEKKEGR